MDDDPPNLLPDQPEDVSPTAKVCRSAIDGIRFVADNTDREFASKIFAVVIAVCYIAAVVVHELALAPIIPLSVLLAVPIGLIWFPDEIGGFTGYVSRGSNIDSETPPALVAFIGWLLLFLIGIPVVATSLGYE